jgi:hypothetical protein
MARIRLAHQSSFMWLSVLAEVNQAPNDRPARVDTAGQQGAVVTEGQESHLSRAAAERHNALKCTGVPQTPSGRLVGL